jgi:hypothetical protein
LKFNEAATASCASRRNISIEYGVPMRYLNLRFSLLGKADATEFHRVVDGAGLKGDNRCTVCQMAKNRYKKARSV